MLESLDYHFKKNLKSFSEDNAYIQFILDLSSYIPVEYVESGPIENSKDSVIKSVVDLHKKLNFKVDLDGIYLKKPIFFPKKDETKVISFEDEIKLGKDQIKFKGYFYVQHGTISPKEFNGIAIRIRNIPIADQFGFDSTFLRYPIYTEQIFRNWISGEVYVEKGLEDAMNIDRKSFRVTHPHYLAIQNRLHEILKDRVFKAALHIYEKSKDERGDEAKKETNEKKKKILKTKKVTYKAKAPTKSVAKKREKKGTSPAVKAGSPIKIISRSKKSTVVEVDESAAKKFKKKDWEVLENVFLIFELAIKESKGNIATLRELFYSKINEWKDIK